MTEQVKKYLEKVSELCVEPGSSVCLLSTNCELFANIALLVSEEEGNDNMLLFYSSKNAYNQITFFLRLTI